MSRVQHILKFRHHFELTLIPALVYPTLSIESLDYLDDSRSVGRGRQFHRRQVEEEKSDNDRCRVGLTRNDRNRCHRWWQFPAGRKCANERVRIGQLKFSTIDSTVSFLCTLPPAQHPCESDYTYDIQSSCAVLYSSITLKQRTKGVVPRPSSP
jgi:hypothetical protein